MEDRIIELEARIAHQERTIDEVGEVLTAQQARIDDLERRIAAILAHIREAPAPER